MSAPAKGLMRVTNHPRNDEWLLLKFGPDLNGIIGTFGPAQQALDLGGYVMHRDQLDALRQWSKYQSVTLFVEARSGAEPTKPVQCGNVVKTWVSNGKEVRDYCCAPFQAGKIPKFCGACGQAANPVIYGETEPDIGSKCAACARINHGGAAYCLGCGEPLPEHHLSVPAIARVKAEPVALGDAIAELAPRPVTADAAPAQAGEETPC
jgi:hypothetical protein